MKKINILTALIFAAICITSCKKESERISKLTQFAVFSVEGDSRIILLKGTPYVEPGATAKEGDDVLEVNTSGLPDVNTPGVYDISYKATNKDGYKAEASRTVIVYSTDASAAMNDFSGNYERQPNKSIAVWTKIAPGVYEVFNPGGAPGTDLTVIVFNQTAYNIKIPEQMASGSPTSSDIESTTPGIIPGTIDKYSMKIVNVGYGPSVRNFIKK
jgi:hypothetical protein